MSGSRSASAFVALWLLCAPLSAQEGELPAYRIPATDSEGIELDGVLSENVWLQAPSVTDFRQREPLAGRAATEQTVVRIAYDDRTLYVGIIAQDSEPDRIVARILQRDKLLTKSGFGRSFGFGGDDAVAILFDPFQDHRNGVVFATNPNGAEFEALVTDEGSEINIDWRGVWEVASARTPGGWSAEFAIPWRTLRYPSGGGDAPWGLNVARVIRRKNEETLWQSWEREGGGLARVSRAGHLTGLTDLPSPGLNLETKPFVLGGSAQERDDPGGIETDLEYDVGLDLKTEVRPGLLLDLTVNTDFAQVEVDDAQVNLTRFSLFFPEKRDFFLENAGIFDFGTAANQFEPPRYQMFFSRRIGIDEDGEVPLLGGARLTGRVGGQTVGLMNVLTDAAYGKPRENFSVARVKRDVGSSAYIGAMAVDRRSSESWNTSAGLDGQFTLGGAWTWDWYAARSFTKGPEGEGYSYRVAYQYFGDQWSSILDHYGVSEGMESEAGFVLRDDIRFTQLFLGRTWRPEGALGLREFDFWGGAEYGSSISTGDLLDWEAGFAVSANWESGDDVLVRFGASETVVDEDFELSDSVSVAEGRYRDDSVTWFGSTSSNRPVYLSGQGRIGNFFGGTLVSVGTTLTANLSPQFSLSAGLTRNKVDVPGGSFDADISTLRVSYSFSTKLATNLLVQYNSLDREFSTNVRFNFVHRPGSDLFLVFTENRGDDIGRWRLQDRGLVMKITYLARL